MDDVLYGVSDGCVSAHDINTVSELNRLDRALKDFEVPNQIDLELLEN